MRQDINLYLARKACYYRWALDEIFEMHAWFVFWLSFSWYRPRKSI